MKEKLESLTAADFFEKLQQDKLDTTVPFSITGMVKKSEGKDKTIEFAPGGNCSNWVTIPLEFIEDVDVMKTIACKDHSHPLVKLNMKTPVAPEGKIFFALLQSMKQGVEEMQYGYDTPERGYSAPGMQSAPASIARLGGGRLGGLSGGLGLGIGGRGLSAWGCWTGSCCVAGYYTQGPTGWQWVCTAWRDCERCIWPW